MGWFYLKTLLFLFFSVLIITLQGNNAHAQGVRILVSPVNIISPQSSYTIYPHISEFIATDIINELNKKTGYDIIDMATTEDLLKSRSLYDKYRDFLKNYKDKGTIDYKLCGLLSQELGIHKIILVSSSFSTQGLILKQPFLYRFGVSEVEAVRSYNRLNVETALIDTQTGIISFTKPYYNDIRTADFETPTSSLNDNIFSSNEIKKFSKYIASDVKRKVSEQISPVAHSSVQSSIISKISNTRDGLMTRDGHSYSADNKYLYKKRVDSFKEWIKYNVDL